MEAITREDVVVKGFVLAAVGVSVAVVLALCWYALARDGGALVWGLAAVWAFFAFVVVYVVVCAVGQQ